LNHVIPFYTLTYLSMMHCNIILSFIPTSPKRTFPFRLNGHNFLCTLISFMCVICPAHLLVLDIITPGTPGEKYKLLRPSLRTQTWSSRVEGPQSEGSQDRQVAKCGHQYRATRNQEWLCWWGPASICQRDRLGIER
jgi:hypothetical protein